VKSDVLSALAPFVGLAVFLLLIVLAAGGRIDILWLFRAIGLP